MHVIICRCVTAEGIQDADLKRAGKIEVYHNFPQNANIFLNFKYKKRVLKENLGGEMYEKCFFCASLLSDAPL